MFFKKTTLLALFLKIYNVAPIIPASFPNTAVFMFSSALGLNKTSLLNNSFLNHLKVQEKSKQNFHLFQLLQAQKYLPN